MSPVLLHKSNEGLANDPRFTHNFHTLPYLSLHFQWVLMRKGTMIKYLFKKKELHSLLADLQYKQEILKEIIFIKFLSMFFFQEMLTYTS
jgi:hypothetical protein